MDSRRVEQLAEQGKKCIEKHSRKAVTATFVPLVSVPLVHSLCAAMLSELNKIFGVDAVKSEQPSNIALGVIMTPLMAIPLWGAVAASSYIETVGKSYLDVLIYMKRSNRGNNPGASRHPSKGGD